MNNTLPKISLRHVPGFGHEVGFNTQLLVKGTRYGVSVRGTAWGVCGWGGGAVTVSLASRWAANFVTSAMSLRSAPGEELCVQVEADADMLVEDQWTAPQNNKECKIVDINVRVR